MSLSKVYTNLVFLNHSTMHILTFNLLVKVYALGKENTLTKSLKF